MKSTAIKDLLIIGIGNSGRRDDGLGWALLDQLQQEEGLAAHFEYRYQLQIEDAALIAQYPQVLFVDASQEEFPAGFSLSELAPKPSTSYTSHAIPPAQILFLCQDLYQAHPQCHLLAISGYEWELKLGLSEKAKENLDLAAAATAEWLALSVAH